MARRIVPEDEYPWWVQVSLWGVHSRAGQWACLIFSILCAVGCVVYALGWDGRFFIGSLIAVAALPYWFTIRWIDRHGSWRSRD